MDVDSLNSSDLMSNKESSSDKEKEEEKDTSPKLAFKIKKTLNKPPMIEKF